MVWGVLLYWQITKSLNQKLNRPSLTNIIGVDQNECLKRSAPFITRYLPNRQKADKQYNIVRPYPFRNPPQPFFHMMR